MTVQTLADEQLDILCRADPLEATLFGLPGYDHLLADLSEDADAAIRECRSAYVDLVMIDAGADGLAGADVLNSIRILKPSVRAVFMEGASISEHRFLPASEDAIERVEKPVGVDRLHRLFARLRTQAWHVPDAHS